MADLGSAHRERITKLASPYCVRVDVRDLEHPKPAETTGVAEASKSTIIEAAIFALLKCVELEVFSRSGYNVQIRIWESHADGTVSLICDRTVQAASLPAIISDLISNPDLNDCGSSVEGFDSDLEFLTETKAAAQGGC